MSLPSYQPQRLPEGQYIFTLSKEPEKRKHTGDQRDFVSIKFLFRVEMPGGDFRTHQESLLPWEDRYKAILLAFGGQEDDQGQVHLSDSVDIVGKSFAAEVFHEPDKKDPTKTWARITNIEPPKSETGEDNFDEDVPPPNSSEDDQVPF